MDAVAYKAYPTSGAADRSRGAGGAFPGHSVTSALPFRAPRRPTRGRPLASATAKLLQYIRQSDWK
eukprot:scaffold2991_cov250-Pinguiococcus_pyrenoidosus.AAC.5